MNTWRKVQPPAHLNRQWKPKGSGTTSNARKLRRQALQGAWREPVQEDNGWSESYTSQSVTAESSGWGNSWFGDWGSWSWNDWSWGNQSDEQHPDAGSGSQTSLEMDDLNEKALMKGAKSKIKAKPAAKAMPASSSSSSWLSPAEWPTLQPPKPPEPLPKGGTHKVLQAMTMKRVAIDWHNTLEVWGNVPFANQQALDDLLNHGF